MKQQQLLKEAKRLSRNEMKQLQGGNWWNGVWVCVIDGYSCSFYQWECEQSCSNPAYCTSMSYCP